MARRSSMRTLAGVLVVVAAAGAVAAVGWLAWSQVRSDDGDVAVIGDSISVLLTADEDLTLAGRSTRVHAVSGARVAEMSDAADEVADRGTRDVVVNLGTNDVLQGRPPDQVVADLEALTDVVDAGSCVHLVTISEHMVSVDHPDVNQRAAAVNDGIRRLADERDYQVIDWSAIVGEHLDESDPQFPPTVDSVHPSESGQALLTSAIEDSLRDGCGIDLQDFIS